MKAWVLGDPDQLALREKPTPIPVRAEVLVRIDAVAICATDLEIIHSGSPASILGGLPSTRVSRRATNIWGRSQHSGLTSTNSGSASG
jgi:NADPH:quinone reductase-like Zn-dependent oxidoreductase